MKKLESGLTIFDLKTEHLLRMKKLGANVTGLDFSEESIRIAKERNPDIKFVENILNACQLSKSL